MAACKTQARVLWHRLCAVAADLSHSLSKSFPVCDTASKGQGRHAVTCCFSHQRWCSGRRHNKDVISLDIVLHAWTSSVHLLTASSFILKKSLSNQKCFQSPWNIWKALISEQGLFWREGKKPTPELNLDPWKSRVPPKVPARGLEKQLSEQSAHSRFICHGIFCFWNINTSLLRGILKQTRTCCQMNNPQTLVNCLIVFKKLQ